MKKIVFLLLIALCLPIGLMAQSYDDDLYFIPSKEKEEPAPKKKEPVRRQATTNIYTTPGTTVVVRDRKGNTRDVDEYNRRYDARDNDFEMEDDTLYITEKSRPDLDGEWVNGEFNGSQDDYEYAERIIRFRNPRFAVSISSPFYWDIVYGRNSWDWNVYTDGLYAYAFPTFSNPMWWDWRYNSFGPGWGWSRPYYGWGGYYGGWYGGGYWGGHWGHHHHYPGYYPGWGGGGHYWSNSTYTNRRSYGPSRGSSSVRRADGVRTQSVRRGSTVDSGRRTSSTNRVVGTRSSSRPGTTTRNDASSTRRSTYTRPSSTRSSSSSYDSNRGSSIRSSTRSSSSSGTSTRRSTSSSVPSYNRGSSTSPSRSYSNGSTTRSSAPSPSRSYSSPSSSSSRSSSSYSGGGSSSRSSSGGGSVRSSRR